MLYRVAFCYLFVLLASSAAEECVDGQFPCRDGTCVSSKSLCNGTVGDDLCDDRDKVFLCKTGKPECVSTGQVCDEVDDCEDGSDEVNCTATSVAAAASSCSDGQFRCKDDGLCIAEKMTCDDVSQCNDGSDEERGMCDVRPCSNDQFECIEVGGHHKCIPGRWKCDGNADCAGGEDEAQCNVDTALVAECANGTFDCDYHKICVQLEKVCDGRKDCPNGADETELCQTSCQHNDCQDLCVRSPTKSRGDCACNTGKRLAADGKSCDDVDECRVYGSCGQVCTNTVGSYRCSCFHGYRMDADWNCRAERRDRAILFFAGRNEVRGLRLDTMAEFSIAGSNRSIAVGIAFDAKRQRVFWTDASYDQGPAIVSSRLDGSEQERFGDPDVLMLPEGLALDYVARNVYFSESIGNYIGVCSLDGENFCTKLHSRNVRQPRELSLYPMKGYLFYSDWGFNPTISRVGMDGSDPVAVVGKDLHWPNGVSVDVALERIFWSDAKLDRLESSRFDGSDRRTVTVNFIRHPFSIAVFENDIFWSDWEIRQIQSCDKFSGGNRRSVVKRTDLTPMGIHVYHPVMEPWQRNPCLESRCTHLCLLALGGRDYKCKCPDGMYLSRDHRTCKYKAIFRPPKWTSAILPMARTMASTTEAASRLTKRTSTEAILRTARTSTTTEATSRMARTSTTESTSRTARRTSTESTSRMATTSSTEATSRLMKTTPKERIEVEAPSATTADDYQPVEDTLRNDRRLEIGLAIGMVILSIAILLGLYCTYSSRRTSAKQQRSPIMRYKNPAFRYADNGSDDVDFTIETNPSQPLNDPDEKLASKLQLWPRMVGGSREGGEPPQKEGLLDLGFKMWKPRTQSRYYKL